MGIVTIEEYENLRKKKKQNKPSNIIDYTEREYTTNRSYDRTKNKPTKQPSVLERGLATTGDLALDIAEGFLSGTENVADALQYGTADVLGFFGADEKAKKIRENAKFNSTAALFGKNEKASENFSKNWTQGIESSSYANDFVDSLFQGVGQVGSMVGTAAIGSAAIGAGAKAVGAGASALNNAKIATDVGNFLNNSKKLQIAGSIVSSFASGYGAARTQAYNEGASDSDSRKAGLIGGIAEGISEQFFNGIPGMKTEGWADKLTGKIASKLEKTFGTKIGKAFFKSTEMFGEGAEEIISNLLTTTGNHITNLVSKYDYGMKDSKGFVNDIVDDVLSPESLTEALSAALTTGIIGGGSSIIRNTRKSIITENYAKNNNITTKEANTRLENEVQRQLKSKGELSYQDRVEQEEEIRQSLLDNMKNNKFDDEGGKDRKFTYKETDNEKVNNMYKSLAEVANDTQKTRDIAKIGERLSRDLGFDIEFTNNEKLQSTMSEKQKLDTQGKTINGFVKDGKMYINVDSDQIANFTIGHETKHFFESNKEMNDMLNKSLKEYAQQKGVWDSLLAERTSLYTDKDGNLIGDPEAELYADLTGQFFTDNDFVRNLSTKNPSLFAKVKDFFQKLYYKATGQKEKLLIKQINDNINQVYREYAKNKGDNNISSSEMNLLTTEEEIKPTEEVKQEKILPVVEKEKVKPKETKKVETKKETKVLPVKQEKKIETTQKTKLTEQESKELEGLKLLEDKIGLEGTDLKRYEYLMDKQNGNIKYEELKGKTTYAKIKNLYGKYKNDLSGFNTDTLNKAKSFVPGYRKSEKRTKQQWLDVAEMIGKWGKFENSEELEKYAIQSWFKETPNQKDLLNRQGQKYVKFTIEDWLNSVYKGAGVGERIDNGIKYSISNKDNTGRELSQQQQEFFKDSKAVDENGNLEVVYHGTKAAGFMEFHTPDNVSFYSTDNGVANTYSGSTEKVDTQKLNNIQEAQEWLDNLDLGDLQIEKNNGRYDYEEEYVITEDGDVVNVFDDEESLLKNIKRAIQITRGNVDAGGIYEGYVNLTNPYIVEGENHNWNNVVKEQTKEILDFYYNLTQEQKDDINSALGWDDWGIFKDEISRYYTGNYTGELPLYTDKTSYEYQMAEIGKKLHDLYTPNEPEGIIALKAISDLQDIAYAGYTKESINEYAYKQLSTNDIVENVLEMNKNGSNYDGVMFKNIIDEGMFDSGREGRIVSNVYATFNSNQFKAIDNTTPTSDSDIRYSLTKDNKGRNLTKDQQNYFKNSKTRDNEGNLITYYNGGGDYTTFDRTKMSDGSKWGKGIYLTEYRDIANMYGDNVKEVYANIENPLSDRLKTISFEEYNNLSKALYDEDAFEEEYDMYSNDLDLLWDITNKGNWADYAEQIKEYTGKDGIIINRGEPSEDMVIVFNSNQVKNFDNTNPTDSPDIRYSLSKDSQDRKLSNEQKEYFKNSKMIDENGKLKVFYHGSPDGTFNIFNNGSYFSPNKEYADGYQNTWASSLANSGKKSINPKTYEVYLNITNPFTLSNSRAKEIYLNEYIKGGNSLFYDPYTDYTETINNLDEIDWTEGEDLKEWLQENHPEFDGLLLDEGGDGGYGEAEYRWRGISAVPFNANQIKNVDNLNPTQNEDIRYSISRENQNLSQELDEFYNPRNKNTTILSELKQSNINLPTKQETPSKVVKNEPQEEEKPTRRSVIDKNRQLARNLLGNILEIKDKKTGLGYQINTMKRNLRDIMDKPKAEKMYNTYFKPISTHNAQIEREINSYNDRINEFKLNNQESTYTQMLGEFKYNPETTLTKQQLDAYLEKNKKKIDTKKVDNAIEEFRNIYDELIVKINDVLEENGYKKIDYRKGYFPHFIEDKPKSFIGKIAEKLGWKINNDTLPTDIAGITDQFRPGKAWTSFSQQRKGDATDYNALKGIDNYLRGAMDVIYHTGDIQKLRALENEIRYQYSDKGIQEKIDKIYKQKGVSIEEKNNRVAELTEDLSNNPLGNFVTEIKRYTDNLANKKDFGDRSMEQRFGRSTYSIMKNINGRVSANMVGANISSAMTNFIPITQAWSQIKTKNLMKGVYDSIKASIKDDGFSNSSTYLTNRTKQADRLYKTKLEKISDTLGVPFEAVDEFTSNVIVRAKYYENIEKGMSEQQAIDNADEFAKDVMAGRSKGDQPTFFNEKNPMTKLFTAFQLEVNNQYGYMFKDIPNDLADEAKNKLAAAFVKMFLGAYLYNMLSEKITGRKSAFSPVDMVIDDIETATNDNLSLADKVKNIATDTAQELPFVGGVMGGGRLPLQGAIPYENPAEMITGTISDISDAFDKEKKETAIKTLKKEWSKPLYYIALPFAGGQIKKTIEGLSMYDKNLPVAGSYTDAGKLRFEAPKSIPGKIQSAIFGQYASENARNYFDNNETPLTEKQIKEALDAKLSIDEYRQINKDINKIKKEAKDKNRSQTEAVYDYVNNLNLPTPQKNSLINSKLNKSDEVKDKNDYIKYTDKKGKTYWYDSENDVVYDSKYEETTKNINQLTKYSNKIDLSNNYDSLNELNYSARNPEEYKVIKQITDFNTFNDYKKDIENIKDEYEIPDNLTTKQKNAYSEKRKNAIRNYINSLNLNKYQKIMLEKIAGGYSISGYKNELRQYIDSLSLSKKDKEAIDKELFK